MSEIIYLSNVRLSFPHLAEPQRRVNETTGKEHISYNCGVHHAAGSRWLHPVHTALRINGAGEVEGHAQTIMGMIQNDPQSCAALVAGRENQQ